MPDEVFFKYAHFPLAHGISMSDQSDQDNRANQLNPNNDAYWQSRGESPPDGWSDEPLDKPSRDNRSRQLNPRDPQFEKSRAGHGSSDGDEN